MTDTAYHLHVDGERAGSSLDDLNHRLDELHRWALQPIAVPGEPLEVSGHSWLDYADLALKALLVIAAFVIAVRI